MYFYKKQQTGGLFTSPKEDLLEVLRFKIADDTDLKIEDEL